MKNVKSLTMVVVLLFMSPVFADSTGNQNSEQISDAQIQKAIGFLNKAGVLSVENSELVVKRPSILDELEMRGRVESEYSDTTSICSKQQ